jgi:uncharacterized protein YndB with AHSA1/START domain
MDKPKFVYVTYIHTTAEKLWQALTSGDFTEKYWNGVRVQSDWKEGATIRYATKDKVWWEGEITTFEPPRKLSYTFAVPDSGEPASRVDFEIEPDGNLVKLSLLHHEFNSGSQVHGRISQGWPMVLASLKTLLETGSPLPKIDRECGEK